MTAERQDVIAFERFFLDEHPKLVALALAWTGDRHTARDIAQEALARSLQHWERVSQLDIPGAWVRRVLINLMVDARRRDDRQLRLVSQLGGEARQTVPGPDPVNNQWWDAVRALPDRERAAITLHYLEDLPVAVVAEILEVTPGTVKASLSHARQKLRSALAEGVQS